MIVGHADLLLSAIHGDLSRDQRRSVEAILDASERLQRELEALAGALDTGGEDEEGDDAASGAARGPEGS